MDPSEQTKSGCLKISFSTCSVPSSPAIDLLHDSGRYRVSEHSHASLAYHLYLPMLLSWKCLDENVSLVMCFVLVSQKRA